MSSCCICSLRGQMCYLWKEQKELSEVLSVYSHLSLVFNTSDLRLTKGMRYFIRVIFLHFSGIRINHFPVEGWLLFSELSWMEWIETSTLKSWIALLRSLSISRHTHIYIYMHYICLYIISVCVAFCWIAAVALASQFFWTTDRIILCILQAS